MMKISLSADDFTPEAPTPFVTFRRMGEIVRENHLYSDRALGLSGAQFRDVATATSRHEAEEAVNRLVYSVRADHRKEARQSMREAVEMAKHTESPHQLHYLASMFVHHPEVIRELAKNPHIDQKTQLVILNNEKLSEDVRVTRNLGGNPAIGPEVMRHLLNNSQDTITLHAVTRNAVRKSLQSTGPDTPYVKICDELADTTFDPGLRLMALAGVRSPDVLRKIVQTRDSVFGARELEAVADNVHTPKDVLVQMAGTPGPKQAIQAAFGVTVGQRAARTLNSLTHPEWQNDAVSQP